MGRGDRELAEFLNTWIEIKKKDRIIAAYYNDWILGRHAVKQEPRWSVMRNVLRLGM